MLTDKQIEQIPYKEPICCDVWNSHSTPEQMKLLKVVAPLVYKAMLNANQMDENLSPVEFNRLAENFASALQFGGKNKGEIDFNIFSTEELLELKNNAEQELASKQEFLCLLAHEGVSDSSYEMYAKITQEIKEHLQMLSKLIEQKSQTQTPVSMGEN